MSTSIGTNGNNGGSSSTSSYHEDAFRRQVLAALKSARTVLASERTPTFFDDTVPHTYSDKFAIAELLTNTSVAAISNVWHVLGVSPDHQRTMLAWHHGSSATGTTTTATTGGGTVPNKGKKPSALLASPPQPVTLRFIAHDTCTFLKEVDVEVPMVGDSGSVKVTTKTEKSSSTGGLLFGSSSTSNTRTDTTTVQVTRKIKEYHWKVGIEHQLLVFPANAWKEECIVLQSRKTETILITQQQVAPPLPESTLHGAVDVSLNWFLQQIHPTEQSCQFAIQRRDNDDTHDAVNTTRATTTTTKTKTPRRNEQVEAAIRAHQELKEWSRLTQGFFLHRVEREMLGQDRPAIPRATMAKQQQQQQQRTSSSASGKTILIMEPGSTGVIFGLSKEPTFNGQRVRILAYDHHHGGRYTAEPLETSHNNNNNNNKSGINLPPTLSIKPDNIQPDDTTASSSNTGPPLSTITDEGVLIPTLPLIDKDRGMVVTNVAELLQEQARTLDEALDGLSRLYPSRQLVKLVSVAEASIVLLCKHLERLCRMLQDGLDHVEHLLHKQLIQAIGTTITAPDFHNFMTFHYPRLFAYPYAPTPFCRAIRQPGHFPDGMIAIEEIIGSPTDTSQQSPQPQPISTWMRTVPGGTAGPPIRIPIHAAANVEITGDRFLHGWMLHQFGDQNQHGPSTPPPQLACRARQFSSFLVILGTVAGPDSFAPSEAIILQNKDEVLIPLLLKPLPSAKAFREATQSLSPEQQEFCQAFRTMQLSSSVFGVCVIQLKPQLEKLLALPTGSLTKEIKLTQDLMSLFVDYQIPSDMLTYDGPADQTGAEKLVAVKSYVANVLEVIDESKKRQLKEEEMKADMRTEVSHKNTSLFGAVTATDGADDTFSIQTESFSCSVAPGMSFGSSAPQPASRTKALQGRPYSTLLKSTAGTPFSAAAPLSHRSLASAQSNVVFEHRSPPHQQKMQRVMETKEMMTANNVAPKLSQQQRQQQQQPMDQGQQSVTDYTNKTAGTSSATAVVAPGGGAVDFTQIPKLLDAKLEMLDSDGALRSTTIKALTPWQRSRQENLLVPPMTSVLTADEIRLETKRAFDLLDCLSRSGTLPIACAELHVFVAVSHCFAKECVQTIVQDNINPIAKVERSALILAATTLGVRPDQLLESMNPIDAVRLQTSFPQLFTAAAAEGVVMAAVLDNDTTTTTTA